MTTGTQGAIRRTAADRGARQPPDAHVHFLTVAQVAIRLGTTRQTVCRMVTENLLPSWRLGRAIRIPEHAIPTLLGKHTVLSPQQRKGASNGNVR